MKAKVKISDLVEGLMDISTTVDRSSSMPTSSCYLRAQAKEDKGNLILYSTDLMSEVLLKIPAEVAEDGETLFSPSQMLNSLAGRPAEEQVVLSQTEKGKRIRVNYNTSRSEIGIAEDTGGAMKNRVLGMPLKENTGISIKGRSLDEFIKRTKFCIPVDSSGAAVGVIGGMMFATNDDMSYEAQATDGAIAAQIKINGNTSKNKISPFLVPLKSLQPLERLAARRRGEDVQIIPGEAGPHGITTIYYKFGEAMFGSRLLSGQFPALKQLMESSKGDYVAKVKTEDLKGALGRASGFCEKDKSCRKIILLVKDKELEIKASNRIDEHLDIIPLEEVKPALKNAIQVTISIDYLFNIASGSNSEHLSIGVKGPVSPLVITDESGDVTSKYILMPIRT